MSPDVGTLGELLDSLPDPDCAEAMADFDRRPATERWLLLWCSRDGGDGYLIGGVVYVREFGKWWIVLNVRKGSRWQRHQRKFFRVPKPCPPPPAVPASLRRQLAT